MQKDFHTLARIGFFVVIGGLVYSWSESWQAGLAAALFLVVLEDMLKKGTLRSGSSDQVHLRELTFRSSRPRFSL